jgi:hypothetical protein
MNRKLKFTVVDAPAHWRTDRIMEICEFLTGTVLEPFFLKQGAKWNRRFMDFFTFDNGCDPLEPVGTICFRVPPMFAGNVSELEVGIRKELGRLKIETGTFSYERHPVTHQVKAMRISIVDNPTALKAPPEVNMSQTRGCVVLRDLLGYQVVNGRYEFATEDLLKRTTSVSEEKIAACTASPVNMREGVRRVPSAASMKAVKRCLTELKQFGEWALHNNHPRLAAV